MSGQDFGIPGLGLPAKKEPEELQKEQSQTEYYSMDVDVKAASEENHLGAIGMPEQATAQNQIMHDNHVKADQDPAQTKQEPVIINSELATARQADPGAVNSVTVTINSESEVVSDKTEPELEDINMDAPASPDLTGALEAALERSIAGESAAQQEQDEDSDEGPMCETDSDPYVSSSEDSDDDSDDDDEGELLSLEETAALLMQQLDEEDEEGHQANSRSTEAPIRSKNEVPDPVLPKPDVVITSQMAIKLLGKVRYIVENTVVIESHTTGEQSVLDIGSVLCKEDRTVIGALAEVIGTVTSPLYTVGFENADDIKELGLAAGTPIYYSEIHARYVFTQELKRQKYTDASNVHDEEVAQDDMEFSDDDQERAFKKERKLAREARRGGGQAQHGTQPRPQPGQGPRSPSAVSSATLNYDDDEDGPYRPLTRPPGFGTTGALPPRPEIPASQNRGGGYRGRGNRGRGSHRGRGNFRNANDRETQNTPSVPTFGAPPQQWAPNPNPGAFNFSVPPPPPPPPPPSFIPQQQQGAPNYNANSYQPVWNQAFGFIPAPVPGSQVPPPPPPPAAPPMGFGSIPIPPPGWPGALNANQLQTIQAFLALQGQQQQQQQQQQAQSQAHYQQAQQNQPQQDQNFQGQHNQRNH